MATLQTTGGQGLDVPVQLSTTKEDKENYQLFLFVSIMAMAFVYAAFFGNFLALDFVAVDAAYRSAKFFLLFFAAIKVLGMAFSMFASGTAYATDDSNYVQLAFLLVLVSIAYSILLLVFEGVWWGDACSHDICRGIGGGTTPTPQFYILFVTTILCLIVEVIVAFYLVKLQTKQDLREQRYDANMNTEFEPPVYPATEVQKKKEQEKILIRRHKRILERGQEKETVHEALAVSYNVDEHYNIFNLLLLTLSLAVAFLFANFLALESENEYYSSGILWWFTWLHWYKLPALVFVLYANGRTRVARTTKMLDYAHTLYIISLIYNVVYAIVFYVPTYVPCEVRMCYGLSNNEGTIGHKSLGFVIFGWILGVLVVLEIAVLFVANFTRNAIRRRNTVLLKAMSALEEGKPMAWVRDALARYGYAFVQTIESKISADDEEKQYRFEEVAPNAQNFVAVQPYEHFMRKRRR